MNSVRVAVVDDRRLEVLDLGRLLGDVRLGQALLLAGRRVVGGRDRRRARGRAVGVGVHVLEAPERRLARRAPAVGRGGQAVDVGEADRRVRIAQRLGHRLPHGDHQRRAHDRRAVVGRVVAVGLEVQQPPPERGRGRPHVGLQLPARDRVLGVARVDRLHLHEDRLAVALLLGVVERPDDGLEQLLLLGRDDEAEPLRAGGRLRGGARRVRARVAAAPAREDHRGTDRDDGQHDDHDRLGLHAAPMLGEPLSRAGPSRRRRPTAAGRRCRRSRVPAAAARPGSA